MVNLFNVNEYDTWSRDLNTNFTLDICLCRAVKLNKNVDPDKYGYKGFSNGFDACSQFSLSVCEQGKNVIIFGVGNSLSMHTDNRKNDILVLIDEATNGLDDSTITAEDTVIKKKFFF